MGAGVGQDSRADLHVHSNASDGTDSPAQVIRRAARAGLDAVALTDHDTVAGHPQARRALAGDLMLVPGLELSCQLQGRSVHLLAYLFDPDDGELAAELARIRDDRVLRARAMVDRLVELGVDVSWDQLAAIAGPAVIGRPHIARAMVASGAIAEPREAFTADWIADGGRAYVSRYALDPVRAIRLVRGAGGATVLAHPRAGREGEMPDEQIAGLAAVGLAGVEVFHPDHTDSERTRLRALAADLGLLASGGSDDHGGLTGNRIGCETAADGVCAALISMTSGARVMRAGDGCGMKGGESGPRGRNRSDERTD
jgi:predicted metal-dependent phosphoesterase TrpH